MARCCCCFGLRTGSILIGFLLLLVDLAALVWAGLSVAIDNDKLDDLQTWPEDLADQVDSIDAEARPIINWVVLGLAAAGLLSNLALIFGAASRRRCGQLLWLIWRALIFTLATLALLVILGLSIWLLVDASAEEKIGIDDSFLDKIADAFRTEEERQARKRKQYIALLVSSVVGLVLMSIFWGWYAAVDRNQRRLRHTTVIVKTQHMHTSRL